MKTSNLLSLILLLLVFLTPLSAQQSEDKAQLWVSAGWGGGDGDLSNDDYSMFSTGLRIQLPNRLFIIRGELGRDPLFKKNMDYKLQEVKAMWGVSKSFPESGIYGATGLSYSIHKIRDKSIPDQGPLPEPSFRKKMIWGMPLELGTHIKLTDGLVLSGSGFINLNPIDIYVGYLVQVQIQLF